MRLKDLNKEQRDRLKRCILIRIRGEQDMGVSWLDYINVDTLVSDEQLEETYGKMEFIPENFPAIEENEDDDDSDD